MATGYRSTKNDLSFQKIINPNYPMVIYSKRLGGLKDEQLQKALDKFDLGNLEKAEKVPFGNFGQNVFVTSDQGEYVLRGSPYPPHQFESEKFIVNQIYRATTVPVPYPYRYDDTREIFGWPYILMPKMAGVQLADPQAQENFLTEDKLELAGALAENLLDLHQLTWSFPGRYDPQKKTLAPFPADLFTVIKNRLLDLLKKSMSHSDRTTAQDRSWLGNLLETGEEAIKSEFTPTFVMQDYKLGNMVAKKEKETWKISGLFDFQEWYFGDREIDLCRTSCGYVEDKEFSCLDVFLKTYLQQTPIRPGLKKRLPVYLMLDRLIIWEWAQRTQKVWWDKRMTLRQWGKPFVQRVLDAIRMK